MTSLVSSLLDRARRVARRSMRPREPLDLTPLDRPTDAIYVTRPIVFEVPLRDCLYPHGMSYGPEGRHPFVATLRAYRGDRDLTYEQSPLKAFYDSFQPASMLDLLYPSDTAERYRTSALAGYATGVHQPFLPWDARVVRAGSEKGLDAEHGHQGFGPVSEAKGKLEFERLCRTYDSIEQQGYRPSRGPNGEIRGYFVSDGARHRFIVRIGQHRTAALAALGHERLRVGFLPNFTRAIDVGSIDQWPLVREGVYSRGLARELVELYLSSAGAWVAQEAGLDAAFPLLDPRELDRREP